MHAGKMCCETLDLQWVYPIPSSPQSSSWVVSSCRFSCVLYPWLPLRRDWKFLTLSQYFRFISSRQQGNVIETRFLKQDQWAVGCNQEEAMEAQFLWPHTKVGHKHFCLQTRSDNASYILVFFQPCWTLNASNIHIKPSDLSHLVLRILVYRLCSSVKTCPLNKDQTPPISQFI